MSIENPLSNYSYTNKDFNAVWSELLTTARKLSAKWDPVSSNESDPGVVLIKLISLLADKLNYNIDANMLELFPSSVAQSANAREIFEQLGYSMKWYRSASGSIYINLSFDKIDSSSSLKSTITIPAFTMVCNSDKSTIYTIIKSGSISTDSNTTTSNEFEVVQGVIADYTILDERKITADMLDSNRRIYFESTDIAENGIFITNTEVENYYEWTKVDLLNIQSPLSKVYKFGVNKNNICYIEFPQDIATLIPDGLYIKYLQTTGLDGNVTIGELNNFYTNVTIENAYKDETLGSLVLSSDNTVIANVKSITNGFDPETIEEAYLNYQKTIGVFETLVSLRDYTDYIYSLTDAYETPLVSNDIISDRTNDIQSSYKIVAEKDGVETTKIITALKANASTRKLDDYEMSPFDLKMYLLTYNSAPGYSMNNYSKTFQLLNYNEKYNTVDESDSAIITSQILPQLEDIKSIQHNFQKIQNNKPCMFIDAYPVKAIIVPKYKLTTIQSAEVRENIYKALYNSFNARKMSFGMEPSYDDVYTTIQDADERIKTVILQQFEYINYVCFYSTFDDYCYFAEDGSQEEYSENASTKVSLGWNAIPFHINTKIKNSDGEYVNYGIDCYAKSVLAGNTNLYDKQTDLIYALNQKIYTAASGQNETQRDVYTDFNYVTSSINITLTPNEETTLKKSENIFIQKPSYYDAEVYSTNVKFEYYFPSTETSSIINSGTSYQLKTSDYIIFYWLDASSESDRYKYKILKAPSIISPQGLSLEHGVYHKLSSKSTQYLIEDEINISQITEKEFEGEVQRSDLNDILKSYSGKGTSETTWTTNGGLLSTERTITKKEESVVAYTANDKKKYYWVLNEDKPDSSTNKNYYILFKETEASSESYQLGTNEYFIACNNDMTVVNIYGSGTKIVRTKADGAAKMAEMKVEVVDDFSINDSGIDILNTKWIELYNSFNVKELKIQEMEFIVLGQGSQIKSGYSYTINSTSITELQPGDTGAVYYRATSEDEWSRVTQVENVQEGWTMFSRLNIEISADSPQVIQPGQSLTFYYKDKETCREFISTEDTIVILQSSQDISVSGGEKVDISYQDVYEGETRYVDIYAYSEDTSQTIVDGFLYKDDGSVILTFYNDSTNYIDDVITYTPKDKVMKFDLPGGQDIDDPNVNYIVPITIDSYGIKSLTLSIANRTEASEISLLTDKTSTPSQELVIEPESGLTELTKGKTYFIKLHSIVVAGTQEDAKFTTLTLSITKDTTDQEVKKITIQQIVRFAEIGYESYVPTASGVSFYDDLLDRIHLLDYDNIFNYAHVVDEDVEINDPLNPESFFNTNHIYNKYTIGKICMSPESYMTKKSDIYITNNIK